MDWFIAALLTGLFFASSRLVSKYVLRKKGNPLPYTALHDLIAGIVLIPFFFFDFALPSEGKTWVFFGLTVFFLFLADYLVFKSIKLIDISLYQIIIQVRHIFVLIGGFILFTEGITLPKVIAIFLIMFGASVALYQKSKLHWSKGAIFAFFQALFASLGFFTAKFALRDFSEASFASLELMGIGLLGFLFMKLDAKKLFSEFKLNHWKLVLAAVLFGFFELFMFISLKLGDISKVIPVTQVSLVFVVFGGIVLLKEYERVYQKLAGTVLIIIGILLMYLI